MSQIVGQLKAITGFTKDGEKVWKKVGILLERNGGQFILMDKSFNPSGIYQEDPQSASVLISVFPYETKEERQKKFEGASNRRPMYQDYDDDIPF